MMTLSSFGATLLIRRFSVADDRVGTTVRTGNFLQFSSYCCMYISLSLQCRESSCKLDRIFGWNSRKSEFADVPLWACGTKSADVGVRPPTIHSTIRPEHSVPVPGHGARHFCIRPFSAEGYSEMSTENQMSTEIPAYSEIIQAPVLIFNIFSSQNPQFPYMKKPNLPMVGLE